jgi:hypothetical protein
MYTVRGFRASSSARKHDTWDRITPVIAGRPGRIITMINAGWGFRMT